MGHGGRGTEVENDEARMVRAGLALNDEGMTEAFIVYISALFAELH